MPSHNRAASGIALVIFDRWSIRRVALRGSVVYTAFMSLMGLAPSVLWIFTRIFALTWPSFL